MATAVVPWTLALIVHRLVSLLWLYGWRGEGLRHVIQRRCYQVALTHVCLVLALETREKLASKWRHAWPSKSRRGSAFPIMFLAMHKSCPENQDVLDFCRSRVMVW
jgi:hypothetical protein